MTETQTSVSRTNAPTADVTVLGCGLMGAALATAFADNGFTVNVWNRTASRARAVAARAGITAVEEIEDAIESAPMIVSCLGTYHDVRDVLDPASFGSGSTLVNVTTGTPAEAQLMSEWAEQRAVQYLDGAILTYPQHIGTDDSVILLSGSAEAFTRHAGVLGALGGGVRYLSSTVSDTNVLDTSIVGAFYLSALTALTESTGYAVEKGVGRAELKSCIEHVLALLGEEAETIVDDVSSGQHATDQATLSVYNAAGKAWLSAMRQAGWKSRMIDAASRAIDEAVNKGHGEAALSALTLTAHRH